MTGIAGPTPSKALQWMQRKKIITYSSGKNGYGIHIIFNDMANV